MNVEMKGRCMFRVHVVASYVLGYVGGPYLSSLVGVHVGSTAPVTVPYCDKSVNL